MQEVAKSSSRWRRFQSLFQKGHFDVYVQETEEANSPGVLWLNVHLTGDISIHVFPSALEYSQEKLFGYYQKASKELHKVLGLLKRINHLLLSVITLPILIDFYLAHLQDMIQADFTREVVIQELESLFGSPKSIFYYVWLLLLMIGKRIVAYYLKKKLGL